MKFMNKIINLKIYNIIMNKQFIILIISLLKRYWCLITNNRTINSDNYYGIFIK